MSSDEYVAAELDEQIRLRVAEADATFLILALTIESAKRSARDGITLEQWAGELEALVKEHWPHG